MHRIPKNILTLFILSILATGLVYTVVQARDQNIDYSSLQQQMNSFDYEENEDPVDEDPPEESDEAPDDIANFNNTVGQTLSIPEGIDNDVDTRDIIAASILCVLIVVVLFYWIGTRFNKITFHQFFHKKSTIALYCSGVVFAGAISSYIAYRFMNVDHIEQAMQAIVDAAKVEVSGSVEVDGEVTTLSGSYEATKEDESVVVVRNGGEATLEGTTINKSSGDSSDTEDSELYGVNAGILVVADSLATINNATITTSANGSNAVFSTGSNSRIYIYNSTITTTGSSSARGLDATYGGYIEADTVVVTTEGDSCASVATDRGEGTVNVTNSSLETNGTGSPVVYSTGTITLAETTGTANNSQMAVIEGKNSLTITNSTLEASGKGNRNDVDQAGIMIYQSMSGDASEGTGTFYAKDSTLSITRSSAYYQSAPLFFVTNTTAEITLDSCKLIYGSGTLLLVEGTDEWGEEGENGGDVTFSAVNQTLVGDIIVDSISTVTFSLESSSYEGTINGNNEAKSITLILDEDSTITLTGDSYVDELETEDTTYQNINFNGYKLYVQDKAISKKTA